MEGLSDTEQIRMCALTNSVNTIKNSTKKEFTTADIIHLAKVYEKWITTGCFE